MDEKATVRIDKWLWSLRLFKTRGLASAACKGGKVKLNGAAPKPSKEIKHGDLVNIHTGITTKTFKVIGFPKSRVGAKLVANYMEDLTPVEEYEKLKIQKLENKNLRPKGMGRPTKKERREIDKWLWD